MSRKVKKIITRFPNLECGFLAALLAYCPTVCRHLSITTGKLLWDFISTATKINDPDDNPEIIYFNVGQGEFDQHGKIENQSLCQLCSLDLIRESYDFLHGRPWIKEIFQLVRANDIRGERISRHPFNLREIMTALSYNYKGNPKLVLDWLTLAFCGIFECCKAGIPIKDIFNPEEIIKGVAKWAPLQLEWFEELLSESIVTIKKHRAWANKAIKAAESQSRTRTINVTTVGQVKVIEVFCDSFKTGSAGRQAGYQVVIQWNTDGHCQIHGGQLQEKSGETTIKKWVHMGEVASALRLLEAKFRGRQIAPGQDWTKSGMVMFAENQTAIPWYLPEFDTSLYNGTMSSPDIPKTIIGRKKLFDTVCQSLPKSRAVIQVNDNDREIMGLTTV